MSGKKKPNALFIEKEDILSSPILSPKAEDTEKYLMFIKDKNFHKNISIEDSPKIIKNMKNMLDKN
tara:strand:- start:482 stop:679 length:198 start_codon:yes stop_codon:yes gene_type:complete